MQADVRGASQLVESDSQARTQLAALQRDLQQDQAEIGRQRDQLETDRRQIAEQHHRDPLIAAAITSIGLILACLLPLLLCLALLRRPPLDGEAEAALAEFLVQDLISDHPDYCRPTHRTRYWTSRHATPMAPWAVRRNSSRCPISCFDSSYSCLADAGRFRVRQHGRPAGRPHL